MTRKKLTLTIDEKIIEKYKKYCEDRDINISRRMESGVIAEARPVFIS